jgi:hypothetical protein
MKVLTTLLLTFSSGLLAQDKIIGRYRDYFGSRIQLNADQTFKYTWHFDMAASWTKGTWTVLGDTVCFHMVPVYDTLSQTKANGRIADTLILSANETSERVTQAEFVFASLLSGGQNKQYCPGKLLFKGGKLYKIQNGKLVTKKQRGYWTSKKRNPWFFKSAD